MIRINLLPHREAAKKARKDKFMVSALLAGVAGLGIAALIYLYFQILIADQESANRMLEQENARLKVQIKEVETIEAEIAALKARQQAVEDLQSERNLPVDLMNHIIREVPNGSYVTSLQKTNKAVALQGMAQSNQTVSDLLGNVDRNMPWESRPQLVETKATDVDIGGGRKREVYGYSMNFRLDKPGAEEENSQMPIK